MNSNNDSQPFVYVSCKRTTPHAVESVFTDESIAILNKCKECVVFKVPLIDSKFRDSHPETERKHTV